MLATPLASCRDAADEIPWATPERGAQFRSRDLFPQPAAAIASAWPDGLAERLNASDAPDVPPDRVAEADGYGNLKTTVMSGEDVAAPLGSAVRVRIGDIEREAEVSGDSPKIEEGRLGLAPGSSGWTDAAGEEKVWMELFLRGSAWEEFGRPRLHPR